MAGPPDPQQDSLYLMEREALRGWDRGQLPVAERLKFAKQVCRMYGVPQVKLEVKPMGKWAGEYYDGRIVLASDSGSGRTVSTLAHELAHHLHTVFAEDREHEPHGPAFATCYIHLFDRARLVPAPAMYKIMDRFGIEYHKQRTLDDAGKLARLIRRARR
jgi:hypothetical protein